MKVLLTGGTGFIGSHVLARLAPGSHETIAVRRNGGLPRIRLKDQPRWLEKPMDELTTDDFSGVEAFVHLAAAGVPPRVMAWDELFHWNVSVMLRLMVLAQKAGVRRVVLAGSYIEYGRSADRYDFIPVTAPLLPTSAYAASKAAGFTTAYAFAVEHHMELSYQRIFSAFGEGQYDQNFWPSLRRAALEGRDFPMTLGEQIRDFIPVAEVAESLVEALFRTDIQPGCPQVSNVGTGNPVSVRQFAETWWDRWAASGNLLLGTLPYRPEEPMRFAPDISTHR